jgi:5-(carboxyamino)imidazole ribonucleotide synthase
MTLQAAIDLDLPVAILAAHPADSAARVWPHVEIGSPKDETALRRFAERCAVLTFEHELVDPDLLDRLESEGVRFRPPARAIAVVVDKRAQRRLADRLGIPQPAWSPATSPEDVVAFARRHGWPTVVKAARGGYDGRGVRLVATPDSLATALSDLPAELLVEAFVPIAAEVSQVIARRPSGEVVAWPLVETVQRDGVCTVLRYPSGMPAELERAAREAATAIAEALDVAGILAMECFVTTDGALLMNELAFRPHNTGHWTIEGTVTSQFENHLRGVLDLPLGRTEPTAPAVCTVNVFGPADGSDPRDRLARALAVPGARIHLYGKEPRPGRKLGHVTVLGDRPDEVRKRAQLAADILMANSTAEAHR